MIEVSKLIQVLNRYIDNTECGITLDTLEFVRDNIIPECLSSKINDFELEILLLEGEELLLKDSD